MRKRIFNSLVLALILSIGVALTPCTAQAGYMQFQYYDPYSMAGALTIDDNAAGDANATDGIMSVSLSVGNWLISGSLAVTYNTLGTASAPKLDLSNLSVSSQGGGELLIGVSANNYIGSNGFMFSVGGTTDGSVTFDSFYDSGNGFFGASSGSIGSLFGDEGPFKDQTFGMANEFDFGTPYSLSITADILHDDEGVTSFDANLTAVPEPGSLILLGLSLFGLLGIGRRITG